MNSKERHERRYHRRKEKRLQRKRDLNNIYGNFEEVVSVTALVKTYELCRKNVGWKASVQKYGFNLLKNSIKLNRKLLDGEDTFKGFYQFTIYERGKKRNIRSIHISERCIEKSLAMNAYVPMLKNSLIYDNSASLKGRGTDYARKRILKLLQHWYCKHGTDGYVIVGDFTSFFDGIDHDVLLNIIDAHFDDKRFVEYTRKSIAHYGGRGLGLGSELNQIYAISVPNRLDHHIKCRLGIKYYHRYNDDFILFVRTKDKAKQILEDVRRITKELGITLSERKTHITKISKGFTFLKRRYTLTCSGKIITRHNRRNVTTERRKLKKFKAKFDRGEMTYETIEQQYMSWRGYLKHTPATSKNYSKKFKNEYRTICMMDKLFNELFIENYSKEEQNVYSCKPADGSRRCHG